jgi:hypothetical protein
MLNSTSYFLPNGLDFFSNEVFVSSVKLHDIPVKPFKKSTISAGPPDKKLLLVVIAGDAYFAPSYENGALTNKTYFRQ